MIGFTCVRICFCELVWYSTVRHGLNEPSDIKKRRFFLELCVFFNEYFPAEQFNIRLITGAVYLLKHTSLACGAFLTVVHTVNRIYPDTIQPSFGPDSSRSKPGYTGARDLLHRAKNSGNIFWCFSCFHWKCDALGIVRFPVISFDQPLLRLFALKLYPTTLLVTAPNEPLSGTNKNNSTAMAVRVDANPPGTSLHAQFFL